MSRESGVIQRTSCILADLVGGKVHDRHTISERFGVAVAAADRYIRHLQQVPGVVAVREGRRLAIRFDVGDAMPRPSYPAAVAACWASGMADVFGGSEYERGTREALAYVTNRARRSSEFKHVDRKFLFLARGGESSLPESAEHLDELIDAVLRNRYTTIDYVHFDDRKESARIQPLSMAIYDHQVYVVASRDDGTRHPFRLSRIKSVSVGRESFPYPERAVYDPKQLFRDSFGIFIDETKPVVRVRVRLAKRWRFYCHTHRWHPSQRIDDVPDGVIVTMSVRSCWELKAWVLGLGSEATVLEPAELADDIRKTAAKMMSNYATKKMEGTHRKGPRRAQKAKSKSPTTAARRP
jgi:predicted DNA-binding transcriptional regulator YafY